MSSKGGSVNIVMDGLKMMVMMFCSEEFESLLLRFVFHGEICFPIS